MMTRITWHKFSLLLRRAFAGGAICTKSALLDYWLTNRSRGLKAFSFSKEKSEAEEPEKVLSVWTTPFLGK